MIVTDDPIAHAYPIVGVGQVPAELDKVCSLYREKKPRRVLEIGTWYGGTLRKWLQHAQPNATVVAVDLDHVNPGAYEGWMQRGTRLVVLTGDSQDEAIQEQIRAQGPYDWIFIDGDHEEDGVDADVRFARSVASPGAMILLHDIDPGGSDTTGPRAAFARLQLEGLRTSEIIERAEGTGYPAASAHGIGVIHL